MDKNKYDIHKDTGNFQFNRPIPVLEIHNRHSGNDKYSSESDNSFKQEKRGKLSKES